MKKCFLMLALLLWVSGMTACSAQNGQSPRGQEQDTAGTQKQGEETSRTEFFAMDTYMTFTADGDGADEALGSAEEEIRRLEKLWSVTDEDSEIYQANHSDGVPVMLSEDTAQVVRFALEMADETDGALEPTIYPVLCAWGFTTGENRIPGQQELDQLLSHVGYEQAELKGNQLRLPKRMELDLGAVGKGYAGDLAAEILRKEGISSALLDIGGNIQAIGSRPDGTPWRLGIRSPFGEGYLGVLTVSDCVVVTSGNYERYFVGEDGNEYGHILDPETGRPVDNGLASVTIIAEEGKKGDALSTSLFVMGLPGAEEYWREHRDFEMIAVTEDGQIWMTEGIAPSFVLDEAFANMEQHVITGDQQ